MFIIKKLYGVAALFTALMFCAPSIATQMNVDEDFAIYSNEKPKFSHIFTTNKFSENEWVHDSARPLNTQKVDQCISELTPYFKAIRFSILQYGCSLFNEENNFILTRKESQRREFLLVEIQYQERTLSHHPKKFTENKGYSNELSYYPLSWLGVEKTVSNIINQSKIFRMYDYEQKSLFSNMKRYIKEHGIKNTFNRLSIIVNKDHYLSFHTLSGDKNEKDIKNVLLDLNKLLVCF